MLDRFWVQPEELRGRAGGYSGVADQLEDILARLQTVLAGAGECWGDDEAGRQFARAYGGPAGRAQQAFHEFSESMRDVHRRLARMADNYERVDGSAADRFGSGAER
ncbi:MAG: PE domain-containing protein [Streptosporangiales bacterium]|nr:PE domain-containing protein [Streptosporangiales bacterium]